MALTHHLEINEYAMDLSLWMFNFPLSKMCVYLFGHDYCSKMRSNFIISPITILQSAHSHMSEYFFSACSTHKKFLLKMRHQKCQSKNETIVFLNVNDGVSFPMKYPFDLDTKVFHFIFKNLSVSFLTNNFISDTKLNVNTMSADFCCLWYPQNKSIHENQLKNLNYVFFSVENCRLWTTKSKMIINKYFTTASLDELYSTDKFQFIQNNNEKTHRKSTQIRTHLTCSELKWPASNLIDNSLTIKLFSRKRSTTAQHTCTSFFFL